MNPSTEYTSNDGIVNLSTDSAVQDGSLRRKEVLNDDGDVVILYNDRGNEIAAIELPGLK